MVYKFLGTMLSLHSVNFKLYTNCEAVDARRDYPKEYITWREDPAKFHVNGVYPLRRIWARASEAWREILHAPVSFFFFFLFISLPF